MVATLIPFDESLSGWERAPYAFLAEKERRSGSRRTVEGYSRMLQHFFGAVGKPPERVTSPEVFAFAHGVGLSGREPSAVTIWVHVTRESLEGEKYAASALRRAPMWAEGTCLGVRGRGHFGVPHELFTATM